jgi:3-oxoacyl-[acyl-carrier protein] reductase
MNGHLSPEELESLYEEIPAGRAGTPEEVAEIVCALLGTTDYLTGQIITLDGGWT